MNKNVEEMRKKIEKLKKEFVKGLDACQTYQLNTIFELIEEYHKKLQKKTR